MCVGGGRGAGRLRKGACVEESLCWTLSLGCRARKIRSDPGSPSGSLFRTAQCEWFLPHWVVVEIKGDKEAASVKRFTVPGTQGHSVNASPGDDF